VDKLFSLYMDKIVTLKVLSDKQIGQVMRLLIDYQETGETGEIPDTPSVKFAFEILKQSLDALNEKRRGVSKSQRDRVNKRWAKNEENTPAYPGIPGYNPVSSGNTQAYRNIPDYTNTDTETEKDKDKDKEKNKESGGGISPEKAKNKTEPPPPILQIKKESESQGFFIDTAIARKFQNCGADPSWLAGPHSFLKFAAERVRKKYPDKNDDELKPLYISAVMSWEELPDAYPLWRAEQEKKAEIKAHNEAVKNARNNPPQKCQCGGRLNSRLKCEACGGVYSLDENICEYIFNPPGGSLSDGFQDWQKRKHGGKV
jgi:hypothetical protein